MAKAKQTHPGRGRSTNSVGGDTLNQPGFGGGEHRQKDGSLNLRGFGAGQNGNGIVKHGMGSTPIPKDEQ